MKLTVAIATAIALGVLAISFWRRHLFPSIGRFVPPTPRRAAAPVPPVCADPLLSVAQQPSPLVLQNVTGGQFWADVVSLEGVNTLTSDLVIVAEQLLKVSGTIQVPRFPKVGDPPINVTLICHDGEVHLLPSCQIDLGEAAPGANINPGFGMSVGDPGANGGHLTVVGVSILHKGAIAAADGGRGGEVQVAPGSVAGLPPLSAVAVSGGGGNGGGVLLCALETVKLMKNSITRAGSGGEGAMAIAASDESGQSYARSGDSGASGQVRFESMAAGCMILVEAGAQVNGGGRPGRRAKEAIAEKINNPNFVGRGGDAEAIGGLGAPGGEVLFSPNCRVDNRGTIASGPGESGGGEAQAFGGVGGSTPPGHGFSGGNATATGGRGGSPGKKPSFINLAGQIEFGPQGDAGPGGDARARGGDGGAGSNGNDGGSSGSGSATGGANGDGNQSTTTRMAAQAANGGAGGQAIEVKSPGKP